MALDPIVLNLGSGGDSIGSDNVGGVNYEIVKAAFGAIGTLTLVEAAAPMPVTDALGATAVNQVTEISGLAAILAKIIAAPSTEAKQDTGNTSLASILAKIIAAPATEAKQDTGNTSLASIKTNTDNLAAPTAILNGKTTVTVAGTRVVLAASTTCKSVTIKALTTNTSFIYVGSSTVASTNGYQLLAGDSISLDIANLNTVNIDSAVNGEGVTYLGIV